CALHVELALGVVGNGGIGWKNLVRSYVPGQTVAVRVERTRRGVVLALVPCAARCTAAGGRVAGIAFGSRTRASVLAVAAVVPKAERHGAGPASRVDVHRELLSGGGREVILRRADPVLLRTGLVLHSAAAEAAEAQSGAQQRAGDPEHVRSTPGGG